MDNERFSYLETDNDSGVVLGKTLDGRIVLDNGPENVLVLGAARCGKGINTVIPTAFTWKGSAFFLDYKGEAFEASSEYRQNQLGHKTFRINPLFYDGVHQCQEDFDAIIHDLLNPEQKVTCYMVISLKDANRTAPFVKLFVSTLISALLKRKSEKKVLLMLDDVSRLWEHGILPILSAIPLYCGAKFCIVSRDIQLYHSELQVLCSIFTSEYTNDEYLTNYLSDILGGCDISLSRSQKESIFRKHFSPDELHHLPSDSIIVRGIGFRPLVLNRFQFFSEPYFMDKISSLYRKKLGFEHHTP